ncbi:UNVERIFIED_CONTAM: hypothetical protein FKN15_042821 [Acipenser sinensis]
MLWFECGLTEAVLAACLCKTACANAWSTVCEYRLSAMQTKALVECDHLRNVLKYCSFGDGHMYKPPTAFAVCAINTCPSEWTLFSGKCYYFSNENRDWKKAREFCQSQDSDLAVINSDEELNYLKGKVQVAHLVGMSDLETEGVWKWLDGSLVDGRMWNPGEPNNEGKEDCGEMSNGKLNDIPCNIKQRWICEKTL